MDMPRGISHRRESAARNVSDRSASPDAPGASEWIVRPACNGDLEPLFDLAKQTGGGFTTFPADRDALSARLSLHLESMEMLAAPPGRQSFILVLASTGTGQIIGTANLCSRLGIDWPFYSYRVLRLTQSSRQLDRSVACEVLQLVNEFDGATEVGGLFLAPNHRRGGLGRLLARSRYAFIARHRSCFADRVVAEMRGYHTSNGQSAFWEAIGRHFFGMGYLEADHLNAVSGNQFIADLMPKYPIYVGLLPEAARAVIGKPHREGEAAYRLLRAEGFQDDGCVDIFDAGPTLWARTDALATVREGGLGTVRVSETPEFSTNLHLLSAGQGRSFRTTIASGAATESDAICLSPDVAAALGVEAGEPVFHALA